MPFVQLIIPWLSVSARTAHTRRLGDGLTIVARGPFSTATCERRNAGHTTAASVALVVGGAPARRRLFVKPPFLRHDAFGRDNSALLRGCSVLAGCRGRGRARGAGTERPSALRLSYFFYEVKKSWLLTQQTRQTQDRGGPRNEQAVAVPWHLHSTNRSRLQPRPLAARRTCGHRVHPEDQSPQPHSQTLGRFARPLIVWLSAPLCVASTNFDGRPTGPRAGMVCSLE